MRKKITVSIICLLLMIPSVSYSRSHGHYHRYGGYNNGWAVGAAIASGILVGAVVGNMIARSAYYNPPQQRVYVSPQSNMAYAYPDPDFIARYGKNSPSGEWVVVPGQSVNGKWVPEHKVWVPINP